ncbi:HipA domain-containing protein [Devosia aquimaris]|uniref:HipA domain-containing protein n=1 Tax=Devosia aquimaris TaxID=2866214 RepID=UPI001CD0E7E4|nr:HipA domain-containing protein [Devosia sp. CJK-A8-3]
MQLDVRLEGFDEPIGQLSSSWATGATAFAYAGDYVVRSDALPLSMALPLGQEAFVDYATRAYFDNLLQERDTARADVIAKYRLANDDIVGILAHLGKDCAGAVSVLPEGSPPTKVPGRLGHDYRPYADDEVAAIVQALYRREPLPQELVDPSPLAGVQSKIAITVLPDGRYAEPIAGAPTTHILKVPQERHERDAMREHAGMKASTAAGFETAPTSLVEIGGIPALLVERFDRRVEEGIVTRVHQEDFCQALGLPARHKYQRPERGANGFNVPAIRNILDRTIDPAGERIKFVHVTLFDILLGNVDGHAKNFALFHLPGGRIRTTPRYDVMPTMLDLRTTDEFAYYLGSAKTLKELDQAALDQFMIDLGFASAAGRKRVVGAALAEIIEVLNREIEAVEYDDKNFADLIGSNIRTLCANLGLPAPILSRGRDTFVR